ncbi:MAG: hypothetical protein IJ200_08350 [Prevotella sp.]|nr:hypothetical protein [Prevotella sp.]
MKKTLLFLAVATCVALSNISCGSDGDGGGNNGGGTSPVTLRIPAKAASAAAFKLNNNVVSASGHSLTAVYISEAGKGVIELTAGSSKKYVTVDKVEHANGTYTFYNEAGNQIGTLTENTAAARVRSSSASNLTINLSVVVPGLGTLSFSGTAVEAQKTVEAIAATVNTENLARTWTVQSMKLTCEGDVAFSMTEESGNLSVFIKEAQDRGANLTTEEEEQLRKTIKSMTLDKNGLFSIQYDDNQSEACSWEWTNSNQTQLGLQLRNSEFGNKFLSNNSKIDVKFYVSGVCHFTMSTKITGSKNYDATLLVVMKDASTY